MEQFELETQRERVGQETTASRYTVGFLNGNTLVKHKGVVILPYSVETLVENHVMVYVERNLGARADFIDLDYADSGAILLDSPVEVCKKADILVSLAPLLLEDCEHLRDEQIVISPFTMENVSWELFQALQQKKITALSLNFIRNVQNDSLLEDVLSVPEGEMAASAALGDMILSVIFSLIFSSNMREAVQTNPALLQAIYCYQGVLTHEQIAQRLKLPFKDLLLWCWNWN